jgi:hypothetical protein
MTRGMAMNICVADPDRTPRITMTWDEEENAVRQLCDLFGHERVILHAERLRHKSKHPHEAGVADSSPHGETDTIAGPHV